MTGDPYAVLGVTPGASTEELRDAYRRLVKLHHPDHNPGSADAVRRFQEIQQAYEALRSTSKPRATHTSSPAPSAETVEQRMADLERELREAKAASERARRVAREAMHDADGRPSDVELGYVTTDDSFGKILGDVRDEVGEWLRTAGHHPAVRRVAGFMRDLEDR